MGGQAGGDRQAEARGAADDDGGSAGEVEQRAGVGDEAGDVAGEVGPGLGCGVGWAIGWRSYARPAGRVALASGCLPTVPGMPPLITPAEAVALGELEDHDAILALVERAWEARQERFGDSTDLCSLVNAKSGGVRRTAGSARSRASRRPRRRCTR
ncbi:hypothetical protein [Baekduia soli]|uniref:hypothetical protein n=1 Tax=Baekduia soli TaxID=496014 RepID=UPI001E2A6296|nr:hypothetical protein [Baekduia soli]